MSKFLPLISLSSYWYLYMVSLNPLVLSLYLQFLDIETNLWKSLQFATSEDTNVQRRSQKMEFSKNLEQFIWKEK